ncbi:IclR family transcriptional regulator [Paenarthrobacter nicotinovorans]|uniref:IclR family transcriptional regulator n=1 Tax=Paenarthrobacter nicotinovorans TaxID=29320 RepID=UPI00381303BF
MSIESSPRVGTGRISKTLDNGIRILELLAQRNSGATIAELAEEIQVEWSVAQRLVLTLQKHDLVRRNELKLVLLGRGLLTLSEPIDRDTRALVGPALQYLADEVGATASAVVLDGQSHYRAFIVVHPTSASAHVSFRVGQIAPLDQGCAGLAILASRPPVNGERDEVALARVRGYAVTSGEVIPSVTGISAPVCEPGFAATVSISVSLFETEDVDRVGQAVVATARRLAAQSFTATHPD